MAKRLFLLLLLALALGAIVTGASRSSVESPVICEEYPNEPWKCAPLDGTMNDWAYLYGLNSPAPDSVDNSTLDSFAFGDDISGTSSAACGVPPQCYWVYLNSRVRQTSLNGVRWMRGQGNSWTEPGQVRTNVITVCLLRSMTPAAYTFEVMHCHSKSNVNTGIDHKVYRRCRSTVSYKWKTESLLYTYKSGYLPVKMVKQSPVGTFACS